MVRSFGAGRCLQQVGKVGGQRKAKVRQRRASSEQGGRRSPAHGPGVAKEGKPSAAMTALRLFGAAFTGVSTCGRVKGHGATEEFGAGGSMR